VKDVIQHRQKNTKVENTTKKKKYGARPGVKYKQASGPELGPRPKGGGIREGGTGPSGKKHRGNFCGAVGGAWKADSDTSKKTGKGKVVSGKKKKISWRLLGEKGGCKCPYIGVDSKSHSPHRSDATGIEKKRLSANRGTGTR